MVGKKGDGCINLMEERMHFVQEDISIVKESMTKIMFFEKSMTTIMKWLDAMVVEIRENLEWLSPNERQKPRDSNNGFGVGSSELPLAIEGNRAREVHDNGNKGEMRTQRVEMPIFYGKNLEEWLYHAEWFFSLNRRAKPSHGINGRIHVSLFGVGRTSSDCCWSALVHETKRRCPKGFSLSSRRVLFVSIAGNSNGLLPPWTTFQNVS